MNNFFFENSKKFDKQPLIQSIVKCQCNTQFYSIEHYRHCVTAHSLTLPAANFCAVVQSPKLPGSSGLLHFFLAALAAVLASSKSQVSSRAGRPVKQSQVGAFRQSWGEIVD